MRRGWPAIALAAAAGACFSPEARDGLPCSEAGDCPPGQSCQLGTCSGEPVVIDASIADAPAPDAAVPPALFGAVELVPLTCPMATPCLDVRDPFVVGEGTTILFTFVANPAIADHNVMYASRASTDVPFAQAASLGAVNTTLTEHSPILSPDGATLWFARENLSSGAGVRPYNQILVSVRPGGVGPFDTAAEVLGAVNTQLGDERSAQVSASATWMLFTRSSEKAMLDHDVYLTRFEGGQWNTVERVAALSAAGKNDRSVALVEDLRTVFFIRDEHIHEAIWQGDDPTDIALEVVHEELDATPLDNKVGLWVSPDGSEIWFDSGRSGAQQIYRAVRGAPTSSGGRIRRRPIP